MELSKQEIERYSRHLIIPEVGMEGQRKLKDASILLIGAGGLGAPLSLYLGAAGVGRLGIVDFDVVDFSNLQRQVIHSTADVGKPKLESAKKAIAAINPNVQIDTYETRLSSQNSMEICKNYDIVIDGTDNFATRYLVNDTCVLLGKVNIYGSIYRFDGQASVFDARKGPCYRCLYPEAPPPGMVPSCAEGGVLGIMPGIIGLIQATEAIKLIIGQGNSLIGRLLQFNALSMKFHELKLRKDPDCPICGKNKTITSLIDYEQFCGITPSNNKSAAGADDISAPQLKDNLDSNNNILLLDVREPHEYEICHLEGATLIPLGTLETKINELDRDRDIVVYCKAGVRGGKALKILQKADFKNVKNLYGGILAWADEVDTNVPKY